MTNEEKTELLLQVQEQFRLIQNDIHTIFTPKQNGTYIPDDHPLALMAHTSVADRGAFAKIARNLGVSNSAVSSIMLRPIATNFCSHANTLGYKLVRTGPLAFAYVKMSTTEYKAYLDSLENGVKPKKRGPKRSIQNKSKENG